jgi:signal transduction histidine kinase
LLRAGKNSFGPAEARGAAARLLRRMLSSPARHYRSLLFGAGPLALLLVLLAGLQYRWLGQVSDADAARLRAGASERAEQFARDFDREITRAFLRLRVDGETARKRDGRSYARRWARWSRVAAHPAIVQAVYIAGGNGALVRFDPPTSSFRPASWPRALLALRGRFRVLERFSGRPPGLPPAPVSDLVDDEAPALVGPILPFRSEPGRERRPRELPPFSSFSIVQLDGQYLRERLLPELAQRHFGAPGDPDYTLVVERRADPGTIVYRTDPNAHALDKGAAATAGLFDIRFGEAGLEDAAELAEPPRVPGGGSAAGMRAFPFGAARPRGPAGPRGDGGHWRLVVRHRAGPVDAVVAAARRRNLAVGAGTLALLAASAVLIVVSAQRSRQLADRQLEFVAGVSHELRTPLSVICSAGENLADGVVAEAGMVRQYGRLVRDEGRRLAEMVEQVLDLAGTYSGRRRWRLEEVSVLEILAESMAAVVPALREAGVKVESDVEPGLPRVRADKAALSRAVQNLLQNAICHGGEGGWVGLRAGLSRDIGQAEIVITVEDRGPGVPTSEVGHIFEPFFRGTRALQRQVHGTGLGLSLVKRIVEAHGGTVGVKTEVGRGSAFTISLPALAAATELLLDGTTHTAG